MTASARTNLVNTLNFVEICRTTTVLSAMKPVGSVETRVLTLKSKPGL